MNLASGRIRCPALGAMTLRTRGRTRTVWLGAQTRVDGNFACIDWRAAPLAEVFFAAEPGEPYEIEVGDRLIEGTLLDKAALDPDGNALERAPSPKLGEVADSGPTAQGLVQLDAAQRRAVRAPEGGAQLVLGAAGFGKTTVALHRLAHLMKQGASRGLVVVPSEGLRRLSARTLQRLGVRGVEVWTYDAWALAQARGRFEGLPTRSASTTPAAVIQLKRHRALGAALRRVAARTSPPGGAQWQDILRLFGDRAWLQEVAEGSRGALRSRAVTQTLERTHVQFSETSEQAYAHVDADRLVTLDGARIDEGTPMEDAGAIDAEDAAVLFELARLRGAEAAPDAHDVVVVDEAQELGPWELALVGRAVRPGGTLIVAGDDAQRLAPELGVDGWLEALEALGAPRAQVVRLERSYRSPPGVARIAAALRAGGAVPAPDAAPVVARRLPHALALDLTLIEWLRDFTARAPRASVCVVYRDPASARAAAARLSRGIGLRLAEQGDFHFGAGVTVTALEEVRGLEFDLVVLPDVDSRRYPDDPEGRRALYLGLTRATRWIWVLGVGAPPAAFRAWS